MTEPFDLNRFVEAQRGVYTRVLSELRTGEKRSHWMWFVFPQIQGLGHSVMAQRYAIGSLPEAKAYLAHSLLGPRLQECTELVCAVTGRTAYEVFGSPDDLKFRSCMTLFGKVTELPNAFDKALKKYFSGE